MALIVADRVQETTNTTGTGTLTLAGAVSGYQSFGAIGDANTTYYTIVSGTNWETGIGTYTASGTTLSRDTVLASSAGGTTKISVVSGAVVFCDYPAGKAVTTDTLAYPPAIGATTPAAGTFTTITGQTEVLKGTGANLIQQSQALATSPWFNSGLTSITNNTIDVTDPLGGNTATKIVGLSSPSVQQINTLNTLTYTFSIYLRTLSGTVSTRIITTLSASPFTTIGSNTATVTSTWQRFTFTTTAPPSSANYGFQIDSFGANTIYAWGVQAEIGSTANTYIPTTTTAIYGTPTLSFSGVAGLGLQSDGSLYVSPAGTGALQAQKTDSTATGGNARGANAVDWQTSRGANYQVASGTYGVIVGGTSNQNNSFGGFLGSGNGNYVNGAYSAMGGGQYNQVTGALGFVGAGYTNYANGYLNVVVGGANNTGTANAAVTTQSGTMNGTTAVTLSGSNANIKVGQLITGTSIASYTYVAAISGTALTLSQAASGSSTSTLSFYTPHGVVVGGGNNQATGSYSFIGGGGDAGTAANRNVASGDYSAIVGGRNNTASGIASFIGGGGFDGTSAQANIASGTTSFVGGGQSNTSSGTGSVVGGGVINTANTTGATVSGGYQNTANSGMGTVVGGRYGNTRSITGYLVFPAQNGAVAAGGGFSQAAMLIVGTQTTNATATVLTCDAQAAGTTNQVILPNNSAYYFKVSVIAGVTGAGNTKAWTLEGAIKRGANAASTAIVGAVVTTIVAADAGAATWTVTATADTTNGGLAITFTGQAATTIRVVAKAETAEMTY